MVCYTIPTAVAVVHYILRKNITGWKKSVHHLWLSLLLAGGAIFGVLDHLWNGEVFLIGEKPILDIMLGITITIVILVAWTAIVVLDKIRVLKPLETVN